MVKPPTRLKSSKKSPSSHTASGYISNPFKLFSAALRAVFQFNLNNLLAFVATGIGSIALFVLILYAARLRLGDTGFTTVLGLTIATGLVWAVILLAAFNKYALITAAGSTASFKSLIKVGYSKASGFFAVTALNALIVLGGLILLIIPGVIFMYWFILAPYIYIDQNVSPFEALKRSREFMRGQSVEFFGLLSTSWLFALPAYIPLIGMFYQFFYAGAYNVAWAQRYQSTAKLSNQNKKLPPTDKANWWFIWAGAAGVVIAIIYAVISSQNS